MSIAHSRRSFSDVLQDLRWGVRHVTPFVIFFGGLALVAELLGVKFAGLDIPRTIFIYVVFGLLAGVVVGASRPIASTVWGAGAIGAIVGLPLALYLRILAIGSGDWRISDVVITVVLMIGCAFCAVAFRRGYARAEAKNRDEETI